MRLESIIAELLTERERQNKLHGVTNTVNTYDDWFIILSEAFGEIARELNDNKFGDASNEIELRKDIIHCMAVCCAWLEYKF